MTLEQALADIEKLARGGIARAQGAEQVRFRQACGPRSSGEETPLRESSPMARSSRDTANRMQVGSK